MAHIGNSYLKLFMEDMVSLRDDLSFVDYEPLDDSKSDVNDHDFNSMKFLEIDNNLLSVIPGSFSVHSTPRKFHHWIWDYRSLDDLALVSRRSSIFSQLSSFSFKDFSDESNKRMPPTHLESATELFSSFILKPLCFESKGSGYCQNGTKINILFQPDNNIYREA